MPENINCQKNEYIANLSCQNAHCVRTIAIMTYFRNCSSKRLFCCLPSSVSLSAMGRVAP